MVSVHFVFLSVDEQEAHRRDRRETKQCKYTTDHRTVGKLTRARDKLSLSGEHLNFLINNPISLYCPSGFFVVLFEAESEPAQVGLELAM